MEVRIEALKEFPQINRDDKGNIEKLETEIIEVSETTYKELLRCLRDFRWGVIDQAFVDFSKYIKGLSVVAD
jgi:hypothetical protein